MTWRRNWALGALLIAGAASASPFELERFEVPGGPRVVFARRSGRLATLVVRFDVGSVDDGGSAGLTRLAQHALLSANAALDYPSFGLAVLSSAGTLRLETGLRSCAFSLTADRRDFEVLAPKLLSALLAPRLDRARLPTAVARALHDGREPGSGGGLLELVVSTAINDLRYKNHPYGDPDQIELASASDVERLLQGPMSPANATVVVAGSFDRDAMLLRTRKLKGGRRMPVEPPPLDLPVRAAWRYPSEMHVLAWPVRIGAPRDAAAARLLIELVDRALWDRFREAGAAYTFGVELTRAPWLDLFVAALPIRDLAGVDQADQMLASIRKIRDGAFDEARFERARTLALGRMEREDDDAEAVAASLASGTGPWLGQEARAALLTLDRATFLSSVSPWLADEALIGLHFSPREQR